LVVYIESFNKGYASVKGPGQNINDFRQTISIIYQRQNLNLQEVANNAGDLRYSILKACVVACSPYLVAALEFEVIIFNYSV